MDKILIVDNSPIIRKMLLAALEKEGFEVRVAKDGLSAFDILESFMPDIIFLDLIMPNISGEQFCRILSVRNDMQHTKIVIISGIAVETSGETFLQGTHASIAKGPKLVQHVVDYAGTFRDDRFHGSEHELIGAEGIFPREISRELVDENRHLKVVIDNISEGIVELTDDHRIIFANPAAVKLAGKPLEKLLATDFTALFDEDDYSRLVKLLHGTVNGPTKIGEQDFVELNSQKISINFVPVLDGESKTIIAIINDISKRKIAENELVETREYLQTIFKSIHAGIFVVDAETMTVIDVNPRALEMLEMEKDDVLNKSCKKFLCKDINRSCPIFVGGKISHEATQFLRNSRGEKIYLIKTARACTINGKLTIVESFLDISAQKKLEEKLHSLAVTDELTGLLNRRGFMIMARKQLKIAERSKAKLFLLFADLDKMKMINDTWGHDVGDQALVRVSKILFSFRSSDIIARLGGDEFAILISDVSGATNKEQLIARFHGLLDEENRKNKLGFNLGVSFGVTTYDTKQPCEIEELIARADKAMYTSKKDRKKWLETSSSLTPDFE